MTRIVLAVGLVVGLTGATACSSTGFRPRESLRNREYFTAPTEIVRTDEDYVIRWVQGSWPFYFVVDAEPVDGRLVLAWGASTSTGTANERLHEVRIHEPKRIAALEAGGAFWWEPDGSYVPLVIRDERTRPGS